jgi:uncharacterized protein with HEPN domain
MRDPIRSARLRVHDMLDNIGYARQATADLTLDAYLGERVRQLAAERAIGIISEASRHLTADLKAAAPEIPWEKIAGMGNVLRHDYWKVAPEIIWSVIHTDFPALENALRKILAQIGEA